MIRKAKIEDLNSVIELAIQFHKMADVKALFSYRMAENLFSLCLNDINYLCIVLVKNEFVVGFLAATCSQLHFSTEKVAQELAWFVDPSHRGIESLKMLEAYEAWAKERGCNFTGMVGLGADPITQNLYQRRGYIAQERHFLKPL